MKKLYLQYWEESERGWGVRPDGCSLHLEQSDHNKFIESVYSDRNESSVPDEYDRVVGGLIDVYVSETLYNEIVKNGGSLRLMEYNMNNLRNLRDIKIIVKDDILE